jgi:hypothetical protein
LEAERFLEERLDADFLVEELFRALLVFFAAVFLLALFFFFGFGGMCAPDLRASLKPIAIACFGFLTFFLLRPDFSS